MSDSRTRSSRRRALKTLGATGTAAALAGVGAAGQAAAQAPASGPPSVGTADALAELTALVNRTPMVDTHEHLPDEADRLAGTVVCDDWTCLLGHYFCDDLSVAGLKDADRRRFFDRKVDPLEKWKLIAPCWPAAKNTGYGRAMRITLRELYGIDDLSEAVIPKLQDAYVAARKPGFYQRVLTELGGIEHCQVDPGFGFRKTRQPALLMQDINAVAMHMSPGHPNLVAPTGKSCKDLSDFHAVIQWWFDTYGPYATAVKSQAAYSRGLDYEPTAPEKVQDTFRRVVQKEPVTSEQRKQLEDHLFWFVVAQADRLQLPVKLHTGYYYSHSYMPLARLAGNAAQAGELCRRSPQTPFVFMHIAYPYWQELVAVAKHWPNAYVDMCWAWIIDPVASVQFVKSFLSAAPANKLLPFGGDYGPVESVLGHARMARQGVARALAELVDSGWMNRRDACELVEMLLRGNARRLFRIEEKLPRLTKPPWIQ